MSRGLDHVGLTVLDLERSLAFWCGRLGLRLLHRAVETDPSIAALLGLDAVEVAVADLDAGDGRIVELIEYRLPTGHPHRSRTGDPGSSHVAIRVDDLEGVLARLEGSGAERSHTGPVKLTTRAAPGTASAAATSPTRTGSSSSSSSGRAPRGRDPALRERSGEKPRGQSSGAPRTRGERRAGSIEAFRPFARGSFLAHVIRPTVRPSTPSGRPSATSPEVQVVAGGSASGGAYVVLDVRLPAGASLPPHCPSREAGTVAVLEGTLAVDAGGARRVLEEGELMVLPRGAPRSLAALSDVRLLCLVVPGGVEELADLASPPVPSRDDVAARLTAAGVSLLPPARPLGGEIAARR